MALRNQPYLPLYVQDYLTDEKLNSCSASSQGVYIKIMCILHKQDDYGTILLKQKDKQNVSKISNFALKFAKLLPFDQQTIHDAIEELTEEGVLQISEDKLWQKRMVKDGQISNARSEAGKHGGGNPALFKQPVKQIDKQEDKQFTENEIEDENEFDYDILNNNEEWKISIFQNAKISENVDVKYERYQYLMDRFISEQKLNGKPKSELDYRNHFNNWIKIQFRKHENQVKKMMMP